MTNHSDSRVRRATTVAATALMILAASACSGAEGETAPEVPRTADDAAANDGLYRCLVDRGFAVTRGANGEVEFKDPEDAQGESFAQARGECLRQLETDGTVAATGADSLKAEYASMTALHDCLVSQGIGMEQWPTEAVFVEKDGAFNVLAATEQLTMERAAELCPDQAAALGGL